RPFRDTAAIAEIPHDRHGESRLAASRLSDHAQGLAVTDREGDVFQHGPDDALAIDLRNGKGLDREQRLATSGHFEISRIPSAIRLKPMTRLAMAQHGINAM